MDNKIKYRREIYVSEGKKISQSILIDLDQDKLLDGKLTRDLRGAIDQSLYLYDTKYFDINMKEINYETGEEV